MVVVVLLLVKIVENIQLMELEEKQTLLSAELVVAAEGDVTAVCVVALLFVYRPSG